MSKEINFEKERLETLYSYQILDSIQEKEYDEITNLASLICNTPISIVSIVDKNRQWFKSCIGLEESETSRDISFCTHALEDASEIFEIEDARKDNRFKDNPLVTKNPNVVYYAGVKLTSSNGYSLGTLCVLDKKPRKLNFKQRKALISLGNQVMQLLELRVAKLTLQQERDQFKRFAELSHHIVYRYSENGSNTYHNSRVNEILGYSSIDFANNPSLWKNLIHEDDIQNVNKAIKNSSKEKPIDIIYRMWTKSKDIVWIHDKSTSVLSDRGNLIIEGVAENITKEVNAKTELEKLSQKYKLAVDASNDDIWEWDLITGKTFYSKSWLENLGYTQLDLKASIDSFFAILHPEDKILLNSLIESIKKGEKTQASIDFRLRHKNGHYKWFSARGAAIKNKDGKISHITGSTTDITKRKKIEEENKQVRNQLQQILDMLPSYIYAKDKNGKFLMLNKSAEEAFNFKKIDVEENLRKSILVDLKSHYHKTDLEVIYSKKSLFIPEEQILKKDGTLGWFQTVKIPYQHPDSDHLGVLGISTEITDRKQMEKELFRTKDFLEQSGRMAKVGAWEINLSNDTARWSETTKKIHEVENDFNPHTEEAILFYKEGYNRNRIKLLVENAIKHGEFYDEELEIITAKGNEKWVRCIGAVDKKNGVVNRVYGTIQDITEEKNRENDLVNAKQKLQSIFNEIESVIWSVKLPNHDLLFVTPSVEKMFGVSISNWRYDAEEWIKFIHPEDIKIVDLINKLLEENGNYDVEYRIIDNHKNVKWIRARAKKIYDNHGNESRLDGYITDITDRKKADIELKEVLELTQHQNDRLMNFAYIVSHNLRSHSANMLSLIDLLKIEFKDFEKNQIFNMLESASNNLMETIEHLSEVALLNVNEQIGEEVIDIKSEIEKVIENTATLAEKDNIQIFDYTKKSYIEGLPSYVESILINLITNAIKYASPDRDSFVKINLSEIEEYVCVSVSDNGLGIDLNKYQNRIFKMYQTFHRHKEARGIGLFIIKNQIEAMGGKIEVESKIDQGSTFKAYFKKESKIVKSVI